MKKVSFKANWAYTESEVEFLGQKIIDEKFEFFYYPNDRSFLVPFESFTAEITVKIVPYEQ